jgi:hypothetical protein
MPPNRGVSRDRLTYGIEGVCGMRRGVGEGASVWEGEGYKREQQLQLSLVFVSVL